MKTKTKPAGKIVVMNVTAPQSAEVIIRAIEAKARPIAKRVSSLRIKIMDDYNLARDLVKKLKDFSKEAKAQQSSIVRPIELGVKRIKALFKPVITSAALVEAEVKERMEDFLLLQKGKAKEAQKQLASGRISMSKAIDIIESSNNVSGTRSREVLKITKPGLVPRAYLVPDEKKILAALQKGKTVPGCKLVEKKSIII